MAHQNDLGKPLLLVLLLIIIFGTIFDRPDLLELVEMASWYYIILLIASINRFGLGNRTKLNEQGNGNDRRSLANKGRNSPVETGGSGYITKFMPGGQYIMITFSGGPHSLYTDKVLDALRERSIKATFFIFGRSALYQPKVFKRIVSEGHEVGHQGFHPAWSTAPNIATDFFPAPNNVKSSLSPHRFMHGVAITNNLLRNATNQEVKLFRPPPAVMPRLNEIKQWMQANHSSMHIVLSSLDSNDRILTEQQADVMVEHVSAKAKPGDIILCHDSQAVTVQALPRLLDKLTALGYEFLTISQVMSFPDDSPKR